MDNQEVLEKLLLKLVYCDGIGITNKWKILNFAQKYAEIPLTLDVIRKRIQPTKNWGVFVESWLQTTPEWLEEKLKDQKFITCFSKEYPENLRHIADPPLVLFYEGDLKLLDYSTLAVVGARLATPYAYNVLYQLIPKLVTKKQVIVSGLAKGVDYYSHQLTIGFGGKTIGVVGCGLDLCYPKEVLPIFLEMKKNHLVLSEYPKNTAVKRHHFPMRNRIIAGISQGTCVIEAKERSGSLITAQLALEYGKEVFAIPGEIISGQSNGCHRLIQDGAKCVFQWQDILEELPNY